MARAKKAAKKAAKKSSRSRKQRADEDDEDETTTTRAAATKDVDEDEDDLDDDDLDDEDDDTEDDDADDEDKSAKDLERDLDKFEGMSDRKTRPRQITDRNRDGTADDEEKTSDKGRPVSLRVKPSTRRRTETETRAETIERLERELTRLRSDKPEEGDPVEVVVFANRLAFDGLRRIRRGTRLKVSVPTNAETGEPILARWMSTPKEWKATLRQEVVQEEEAKSRKVRGGASGMTEL